MQKLLWQPGFRGREERAYERCLGGYIRRARCMVASECGRPVGFGDDVRDVFAGADILRCTDESGGV